MSFKDKIYVMRNIQYREGLEHLINYVNTFSDTKNMNMIEIGSYAGESTELFAKHFNNVIAIDPFFNDYDKNDITCEYMDLTEVYNTFNSVISKYNNITHIRKTSDDAISQLKDIKVDLIYIDGMHTYDQVKLDIQNYLPIIKDSGFICGHDYHPVWQGVVNAIQEKLGTPDKLFQDTSWIKKIDNLK
jgi:predicted O-methyltransferase YrrM